MPAPPEITNPSRFASYGREATSGLSLKAADSAPMLSNITVEPQCTSSAPPANTTSCLPSWISSAPWPMACALVAQAELIV
jgi:hypothetical protein